MEKAVCSVCHRKKEPDRWVQTVVERPGEIRHVLCSTCFVETRVKLQKLYSPLTGNFRSSSEENAKRELN